MSLPEKQLHQWRQTFDLLQNTMGTAEHALQEGEVDAVREILAQTRRVMIAVGLELEQMAAQKTDPMPEVPSVPLHLLDTTANRKYAAALREAWQCALAVDQERGLGENGPAQALYEILERVEQEVYGDKGSGLE